MKKLIVGKKKKEASKRGKKSKNKGANYERKIAKIFKEELGINLTRTPQSGGFAKKTNKAEEFKGDLTCLEEDKEFLLHVECKSHQNISLQSWIKQAESDCPKDKIATVVFHEPNSSKEYITLSWADFLGMLTRSPYPSVIEDKLEEELLPQEEWRDLEKPYSDYQVSNLGNVRTLKQKTPRLLKQGLGDTGYYNVALCHKGKPKTFRVHRLVAEYFVTQEGDNKVVNHIDGNKLNNVYTNLEWISSKDNNQHAYDTNLRGKGDKHPLHKYLDSQVLEIRLKHKMYGTSITKLSTSLGVNPSTIYRVIKEGDYRNNYKLNMVCKNLKAWKILEWHKQNNLEGLFTLVIVPYLNKEYVTLRLEDFFSLIDKTCYVKEVK